MSEPTRVLIVDDQPLLRHSLALLINHADDFDIVAQAESGSEGFTAALTFQPDIVLMDIRMPHGNGLEATRRIVAHPNLSHSRVVVLSMFDLDEYVHEALRAGASGFLLKDTEPDALLEALRRIHQGECLFAPSILTRLIGHYLQRPPTSPPAPPGELTAREVEVLTLIGQGLSNHELAEHLHISMGTVKTHVGSLLSKLHARDRAQLVIAAFDAGLVRPDSAGR